MQKKQTVGMIIGVVALTLPSLAFAAPMTFSELVGQLVSYIDYAIPIIIAAAVLVYMKNSATGIFNLKGGKADPEWKASMFWGIIIITLMVSIWGVLSILQATFFG